MSGAAGLVLLLASPVLIVVGMTQLGAFRHRFLVVLTIVIASVTPGLILFVATRDADAITNAAAFYVAPMFCIYGMFVALVTALITAALK